MLKVYICLCPSAHNVTIQSLYNYSAHNVTIQSLYIFSTHNVTIQLLYNYSTHDDTIIIPSSPGPGVPFVILMLAKVNAGNSRQRLTLDTQHISAMNMSFVLKL